jgi:hypothetical protein
VGLRIVRSPNPRHNSAITLEGDETMKFRTIAAAALASTMIAGGAQIAQADEYSMYSPMPVHDWSGLYVGKFAIAFMEMYDGYIDGYGGLGAALGYNWQNGTTIYGVEKYVGFVPYGGDIWTTFQVNGRIGTVLTENSFIYGSLGFGVTNAWDDPYVALGGGVEVAMSENLAWRTHFQVTPGSSYLYKGVATGLTYYFD